MQRVYHRFLFLAICFTAHMAFADPSQLPVPANSFLTQHVGSVSELSRQIASDPVVRRRLARHFHTSSPFLLRYLETNLVLKTLTNDWHGSVYCLAHDGHPYAVPVHLPVGTPVFALRATGQPALNFSSGDPLLASLPGPSVSRAGVPKRTSLLRVAQFVKPTHPKTMLVKTKDVLLFSTVRGDTGLYVMPQKTQTESASESQNVLLGQGAFWR